MYREIEPLLANTICEVREKDGKTLSYRIRPKEGYKLHEVTLDKRIADEEGNETGEICPGFTTSYVTAGAEYDFVKNERKIFAQEV